jgi:hypothetical protein
MRDYLPLVFEALFVGAVIAWGVRELWILRREKKKDAERAAENRSQRED